MIRLTRLNNRPMVVNSEMIKFIEQAPDTVITLATGEKIVVLETADEVMARILEYRRQLREPQVVSASENPEEQLAESEEPGTPEEADEPSEPEWQGD